MNFLRTSLVFFLAAICCLQSQSAQATTCTALSNGNWSNAGTWSCGGAFGGANDTVIIPFGITVSVDINSPTYVSMVIMVSGILDFQVGQKINLDCSGEVIVNATGELTGGNPGSKINICGTTVWNGGTTSTGPLVFGTGPLPVEWLTVSATPAGGDAVTIQWSTATQTNNNYFAIERSTGGAFTEIGRVRGAGNSSVTNDYSFMDQQAGSGILYYRIRQVDFNGHYSFSRNVAVTLTSQGNCTMHIYPNPGHSPFTIELMNCTGSSKPELVVEILDLAGEIIYSTIPTRSGNGDFSLQLEQPNLKQGVYVLRLSSSTERYVQKLVVN